MKKIRPRNGEQHAITQYDSQQLTLDVEQDLRPKMRAVEEHPVFDDFDTFEDIRVFLGSHIYAVWDFMTLLKAFQGSDNGIQPWTPPVMEQSNDDLIHEVGYHETGEGQPESHFNSYCRSMDHLGANTDDIHTLISALEDGEDIETALKLAGARPEAREHVLTTWGIAQTQETHKIAGALAFGRRDIIPDGFSAALKRLHQDANPGVDMERYYTTFDRSMELDWDEHGERILGDERIGTTKSCRTERRDSAKKMLNARLELLDGIQEQIS